MVVVFIYNNPGRGLCQPLKTAGFDGQFILLFEVYLKVLIRVLLPLCWSSWAFSISSKTYSSLPNTFLFYQGYWGIYFSWWLKSLYTVGSLVLSKLTTHMHIKLLHKLLMNGDRNGVLHETKRCSNMHNCTSIFMFCL